MKGPTMKVLLAFPWRGDKERTPIFEVVKPAVRALYPFDGAITTDSLHKPFNRAASRNLAVVHALRLHYDVIVLCDADSIPEQEPLERAIDAAYTTGGLHVPFDVVRVLSRKSLHNGRDWDSRPVLYSYGPSCGGIYIIRPSEWVQAGGMDERITGWGYEDQIFLVAVNTFLGGYTNYPGQLFNINHGRGPELESVQSNRGLVDDYHAAQYDQTAVRRLSVGSNRFCTDEGTPRFISSLW